MSKLENGREVTETKAQERPVAGRSVGKAWGVFLGTVLFLLALQPRAAGDPLDNVADAVLGEPDFAHSSLNTLAEDSMAYPSAVAIDASRSPEAVYVADTENSRVLVWLDAAAFSNGDNADLVIGQPDLLSAGCNSGGVSASSLCRPYGVAVDGAGRLYVADYANHRVLEYDDPIGTDQVADRVFGQGGSFTSNTGNLGGISASSLRGPRGVITDGAGNLYVADYRNHRILGYDDPIGTDQVADRVFGQDGSFTSSTSNLGGVSASSLDLPWGVAVDSAGNLYVADRGNTRVLEYDDPIGTDQVADRVFGQGGSFTSHTRNLGGISASSLDRPWGVAVDSAGNLYVADRNNSRVLEYDHPIGTDQVADRVFGQGGSFTSQGCNLGGTSASTLCSPRHVATDGAGNLYVADGSNHRVLHYDDPIGTDQVADRVLGQDDFTDSAPNRVEGRGLNAPRAVAIDTSREPSPLYVADDYNSRVLVWLDAAGFSNGDSADLVIGQPDFSSCECNQGGVSASSLCRPSGVAVDSAGNLYVADGSSYSTNNRVLEYDDPIATDQVADRVFGQGGDFTSNECNLDGISASSLCGPTGVAVDSAGNLYVADGYYNNRVLEYDDPIATDQVADRVFGQGGSFTSNECNLDGISASSLCNPSDVAVDRAGNLYVADGYSWDSNNRVLEYDDPIGTDQVADRVFGQGGSFTSNECTLGGISASSLCEPSGVAVDSAGILYVADGYYYNRVLEYDDPIATDQVADQVFGQGGDFASSECNLGGISESSLCGPEGVAVDGAGNLYVADSDNHRVLRFDSPIRTPYCGDSSLQSEPGEECDDGNFVSGDGCDWTCRLEFCVALTPPAPPLPDPAHVKCQEVIALAGVKYGVARLKAVQGCLDRITKGKLSGDAEELCRGSLGGGAPTLPTDSSTANKISKAEARARRLIGRKCEDADAAALSSCASTVSALGDCIVVSHWRLAEILDRAEYMTPAFRDAAAANCQNAIGKAGFKYVKKLLKALRNCVNSVNDGTLPPSTDCLGSFDGNVYTPPGDAETAGAIAMAEAKARELIQGRCGDAEIAGLDILDDATTVAEAETRLVCQHRNRVMNMVTTQYGPQP